ncbi:MAG TPA: hypothetical protein PK405_06515 [Hyphomicrobiales bacterium]|nr:hypothetical protein [Rhodobiaceae bacterium]HXK54321.1 hypothetical protein [Hyphomicrobiales bacterium]
MGQTVTDAGLCGALQRWREMGEASREVFAALEPGARVGLISQAEMNQAPGARMVVWQAGPEGPTTALAPFAGFADAPADMVFLVPDEALDEVAAAGPDKGLGALEGPVRSGDAMLFYIAPKGDLLDAGYEEFMERLGFGFLGACR